jgi:8-oxo-dGTP pyrophosphatase MutT (NUDIX family)
MICHPENVASARIATVGAYVMIGNSYLFAVGPNHAGPGLAVFRLGGHLEPGETAWSCAVREVAEEASIALEPLVPPTTYWIDNSDIAQMQPVAWQPADGSPVAPILVASRPPAIGGQLSIMYLARAIGRPIPSAEIRGLLLLEPPEIHQIMQGSLTLGAFLRAGGDAILHEPLDEARVLEPFLQLRALSAILRKHRDF